MYARLDSVREMLVLLWYGKRKIQREPERDDLSLILDGAEGDGSLEAVGGTHGVSPYWYYGGPSCVPFIVSKGEPATPVARILPKSSLLFCASYLWSRTNWRALTVFLHRRS